MRERQRTWRCSSSGGARPAHAATRTTSRRAQLSRRMLTPWRPAGRKHSSAHPRLVSPLPHDPANAPGADLAGPQANRHILPRRDSAVRCRCSTPPSPASMDGRPTDTSRLARALAAASPAGPRPARGPPDVYEPISNAPAAVRPAAAANRADGDAAPAESPGARRARGRAGTARPPSRLESALRRLPTRQARRPPQPGPRASCCYLARPEDRPVLTRLRALGGDSPLWGHGPRAEGGSRRDRRLEIRLAGGGSGVTEWEEVARSWNGVGTELEGVGPERAVVVLRGVYNPAGGCGGPGRPLGARYTGFKEGKRAPSSPVLRELPAFTGRPTEAAGRPPDPRAPAFFGGHGTAGYASSSTALTLATWCLKAQGWGPRDSLVPLVSNRGPTQRKAAQLAVSPWSHPVGCALRTLLRHARPRGCALCVPSFCDQRQTASAVLAAAAGTVP